MAVLADIAIIEVALRNAMHEAASAAWGPHWYAEPTVMLDDRSAGQLASAWSRLPESVRRRPRDDDVPGRLVAQCMFGFWTNLLDVGGYAGRPPRRRATGYESLWNDAFKRAFPGGRLEARAQRSSLTVVGSDDSATDRIAHRPAFSRSWVHEICKNVNDLRNRVAHHEPIITGLPLNGRARRLTAEEGHEQCRMLARMLDRALAEWLDENSAVPRMLAARPVGDDSPTVALGGRSTPPGRSTPGG